MSDLTGRVALVTGGGRDVGAEICHVLAAAGAKVAVNYNASKAEAEAVAAKITKASGTAAAYQADVADLEQVRRMINEQLGNATVSHRLQVLTQRLDGPIGLIGCRIDIRPRLLDEFDQTALETQPLVVERISRVALGADLVDQLDKSRGLGHAAI